MEGIKIKVQLNWRSLAWLITGEIESVNIGGVSYTLDPEVREKIKKYIKKKI